MSVAEMIRKLPSLSVKDREKLRAKLDELAVVESDGWDEDSELTDAEKKLFDERLADMKAHPEAGIPLEAAKAKIRNRSRV